MRINVVSVEILTVEEQPTPTGKFYRVVYKYVFKPRKAGKQHRIGVAYTAAADELNAFKKVRDYLLAGGNPELIGHTKINLTGDKE